MSVLIAAARTVAASSRNNSTTYGTVRSNLDSSVRWAHSARRMSSARMRDEGSEQFLTLASTRERRTRAGPSSAGVDSSGGVYEGIWSETGKMSYCIVSMDVTGQKRVDLMHLSRGRNDGVIVYPGVGLWGNEVGFDGSIVLPDSVDAVVTVAGGCLAWCCGILALGLEKHGGAFADGSDVSVEKGIERFWQDVSSRGGQDGVKGGTGIWIEGYHLLDHGLKRSEGETGGGKNVHECRGLRWRRVVARPSTRPRGT